MTNWDDFRFMLAVARNGSMSGAARELDVNHATVIRRIKGLEEQLNCTLFDRSGRSSVVTPIGEVVLEAAQRMESESMRLQRRIEGQATDLAGLVRLTAPEPMSRQFLIPAIREFRAIFPDILVELDLSQTPLDLSQREADIAIRVTDQPPEDLIGKRVARLSFGIYGPAGAEMSAADVTQVIAPRAGFEPMNSWVERLFPNAEVTLITDTFPTMIDAINAGMGVARLPMAMGERSRRLERIPDTPIEAGQNIWLLSHVDLRSNARIRVFRDFIQDYFKTRRSEFWME